MLLQMNKKTQNLQPDTISTIFIQSDTATAPKCPVQPRPMQPGRCPSFEVATLSGVLVLETDHIIILQSLIAKLARRTGVQKLVIVGLGLAFLGFIVGSLNKEFTFFAGIIFIAIVILGIIGIMKIRKTR